VGAVRQEKKNFISKKSTENHRFWTSLAVKIVLIFDFV
jgi:hypothetical protein